MSNTESRTYTTTQSTRGNAEFGPTHTTWVETIHADGRVEVHAFGHDDGERFDERRTRMIEAGQPYALPLDAAAWDAIEAARLRDGWTIGENWHHGVRGTGRTRRYPLVKVSS